MGYIAGISNANILKAKGYQESGLALFDIGFNFHNIHYHIK